VVTTRTISSLPQTIKRVHSEHTFPACN